MSSDWKHGTCVARREFLERVRSKWFVVVTILGPVAMVAFMVIPTWLSSHGDKEDFRVTILDKSESEFGKTLRMALSAKRPNFKMSVAGAGETLEHLRTSLSKEELDAYFSIPADVLGGGAIEYRGSNATSMTLRAEITAIVLLSAIQQRAKQGGLSDLEVLSLVLPIPIEMQLPTGEGEGTSGLASMIAGYVVMFVLYMAILLYGANVLRSVVMEKTNRVVELIVSVVRPRALLFGKLIGVGGVGLLQLSIWGAAALLLLRFREPLLGFFGADATGFPIPDIAPAHIVLALVFFVLGFLFFSSLFAAVGAMVSSDEEAQQAQTPLVLLLALPAVCMTVVAEAPRGMVAMLLTQFPFTSPVLMPMRVLLNAASPLEIALSIVILILSIAGGVLLAGKIYRVGILMYGKRPSMRELGRWLRYK